MIVVRTTDRMHGPLLLITDMDGAFARGSPLDCARVHRCLRARRHSALIYVTRRSIESARAYQEVMGLPQPDVFVAERGSAVARGHQEDPIGPVEQELDHRWPGAPAVHRDLEVLGAYLDELPNTGLRHLAYAPPEGMTARQLADVMVTALARVEVDVVQTGDECVDVVPKDVSSGFTVDRVLDWMEADPEWVVVAAEAPHHADLFRPGRRGIVVRGADAGLKARVAHRRDVHLARRDGAAGVLEGLTQFGYVAPPTAATPPHGEHS